jgi:hypothetical protein
MRWSNPPRDLVIAADLERIVMGFLGSAVVVGLFTLLSPNWNRPATADPNTDPRKERSIAPGPLACLLGAVTHHLLAMRIAALRTAPGYAAIVDARAGLKKQTGPPFQDIGAMVGGVLGFLLGFREFGNIADRCIEFARELARSEQQLM